MSPWTCTPSGVRTVMMIELRVRLRSTRWKVVLLAAFVLLSALAWAVIAAARSSTDPYWQPAANYGLGPSLLGVGILGALAIGLILAPPLAGASVNGDRAAGVLAPLQMTRLSAAEIAVGKFLAAWVSSLSAIAVGLPWAIAGQALGGLPGTALPIALVLSAVILGVVCAMALALSAITARSFASLTLTYLLIGMLFGGTAVLYLWGQQFTVSGEDVTVYGIPPDTYSAWYDQHWSDEAQAAVDEDGNIIEPSADMCVEYTETLHLPHPERVWWIVAPNPLMMLSTLTPAPTGTGWDTQRGPLSEMRYFLAWDVSLSYYQTDQCWYSNRVSPDSPPQPPGAGSSLTWFGLTGLAADLLLGAGALALTVNRLALPYRKLPKGVRVA